MSTEPTPAKHEPRVSPHGGHWDVGCKTCGWSAVNCATEESAEELRAAHAEVEVAPEPEPEPEPEEPPGPTLTERAQSAQDAVGWATMPRDEDGSTAFSDGVWQVTKLVTDLARQVDRLTAEVARLQDTP
jgi:hypothetical protein